MKSTTIIAFDQHAATTVAAVLLPGHRTPALRPLASDSPTIRRFVERLRRQAPIQCIGPVCAPSRKPALGKPKQHIVTAVARELTGFVWAALTQ